MILLQCIYIILRMSFNKECLDEWEAEEKQIEWESNNGYCP